MMSASVTVECDAEAGGDLCEAEFHIDGIPGEECHAIVLRTFRQAEQRGWARSYDERGRPRFRCPLHLLPARHATSDPEGADQ